MALVKIPTPLRRLTNEKDEVSTSSTSVPEILRGFWANRVVAKIAIKTPINDLLNMILFAIYLYLGLCGTIRRKRLWV